MEFPSFQLAMLFCFWFSFSLVVAVQLYVPVANCFTIFDAYTTEYINLYLSLATVCQMIIYLNHLLRSMLLLLLLLFAIDTINLIVLLVQYYRSICVRFISIDAINNRKFSYFFSISLSSIFSLLYFTFCSNRQIDKTRRRFMASKDISHHVTFEIYRCANQIIQYFPISMQIHVKNARKKRTRISRMERRKKKTHTPNMRNGFKSTKINEKLAHHFFFWNT